MGSPGGGFDPSAALSGSASGQGNAFSGIYTYPVDSPQHYGEPPQQTDPATYEKQIFSQIANDPAQIRELQQSLADAGYTVKVTGMLDAQTDAAYTALLQDVGVANQSGQIITPEQYLAQRTEGQLSGGGGTTNTESSTSFTAPVDAKQAAIQAFTQELGKRPTQHQLAAFEAALHAYEAANPSTTSQTQDGNAFNTTSSGGAGDLGSFAQQYVQQNFPTQAGAHDALHYFDLIANSLSGPPGAAHEVV